VIDAMTVLSDKQAQTVDLVRRPAPHPFTRLLAAYVPGRQEMSIIGRGVPDPSGGNVYRVWLVSPGRYQLVGSFRPEDGLVALSFYVDLTAYSGLLVSEEQGPPQSQPAGKTRWATRL
jgi:hypothetical protein